MSFHNKLLFDTVPHDNAVRMAFKDLGEGDRYRHRPGSKVEQVVKKEDGFMLIRREDGWLIPCLKGSFVWDKMVIKL